MNIIKPNNSKARNLASQALVRLYVPPSKELPASPETGDSWPLLASLELFPRGLPLKVAILALISVRVDDSFER